MKLKKLLVLGLALACVATISITATLAYFTDSTNAVTNTFTVGHVDIELDETEVDEGGVPTDNTACVTGNEYKLYPGKTYTKDPHIHIVEDSEECFVYVKIANGLVGLESATREAVGEEGTEGYVKGYKTMIDQMLADGKWTLVDGTDDTYMYYTKCAAGDEIATFLEFEIRGDATAEEIAAFEDAEIVITAYAIQAEGFGSAAEAWAAQAATNDEFAKWENEETTTPDDSTTTE